MPSFDYEQPETLLSALRQFTSSMPKPGSMHGRGIVTCAGGLRYNTCAWVLIHLLRHVGCTLPIEVWHLGEAERDDQWAQLVEPLGVTCRSVELDVNGAHSFHPRAAGWASKSHAILHSAFEEVLFLDADNVPVVNPEFLFDEPEYLRTGAIFWPDGGVSSAHHPLWGWIGLTGRSERDFESGQMLIDKRRSWQALQIANWFNRHAAFFYRHIYGDKDTFRLAWHVAGQPFAMPDRGLDFHHGTICQHDFHGQRIFQHRCYPKWSLVSNRSSHDFWLEDVCGQSLDELRARWQPAHYLTRHLQSEDRQQMQQFADRSFELVHVGRNRWPIRLAADGWVTPGLHPMQAFWWCEADSLVLADQDGQLKSRLQQTSAGVWQGRSASDPRRQMRLRAC